MARITIEKSIHTDNRFIKLCIRLGSRREALGALIEAWMLAQEFHSIENPRALIDLNEWNKQEIANEIIEFNLASIEDSQVYLKGAEIQFEWLLIAKINGKKGGLAKASSASAKASSASAKASSAKPLISVLSSPALDKTINTNTASTSSQPIPFYCDCYKKRYGHYPTIGKKQAGILTRFAKEHARWKELIEGYFLLPDPWLVQRAHPVEMLGSKINEITRFMATGKVVSQKAVKEFNRAIDQEMGPEPASIEQILAEEQLQLKGKT